ncbi:MAG TPA: hypothetical protein VH063_04320 [Gaiellaceae bacterium]|jgi:hypothetical protein|nr:hypothetical protein [Gaiellaceae bacterium]
MSGDPIDQKGLVDELSSTLTGLGEGDRTRAMELLGRLVADWAREADPQPGPAAVVRYQRQDLETAIARSGDDPLQGIELELLRRRLDHLSAETFGLAEDTVDGKLDAADSGERGRALLVQCKEVAAELDRLGSNETTDAMRRSLGEAFLDALYAVERKAMSQRLAHARPGAGNGPPDIS